MGLSRASYCLFFLTMNLLSKFCRFRFVRAYFIVFSFFLLFLYLSFRVLLFPLRLYFTLSSSRLSVPSYFITASSSSACKCCLGCPDTFVLLSFSFIFFVYFLVGMYKVFLHFYFPSDYLNLFFPPPPPSVFLYVRFSLSLFLSNSFFWYFLNSLFLFFLFYLYIFQVFLSLVQMLTSPPIIVPPTFF